MSESDPTPTPTYGTYSMCAMCPYNPKADDAVHGVRIETGEGGSGGRMPPRHRLFIAHYLRTFNATEAARRAGYKDGPWLRHFAYKLTTKSHIEAAIREGMAASGMSPAEVIAQISMIARFSIEDFIDVDAGGYLRFNFAKAKERGALAVIKSLTYDAKGLPQIVLQDRLEALALMAKILGLVGQRHIISIEDARQVECGRAVMRQVLADSEALELMMKAGDRLSEIERGESGAPPNADQAP